MSGAGAGEELPEPGAPSVRRRLTRGRSMLPEEVADGGDGAGLAAGDGAGSAADGDAISPGVGPRKSRRTSTTPHPAQRRA